MVNCKHIYGVDTNKKITPIMVRDAIIECFINAHKEVLELMKDYMDFKSDKKFEEMKKTDVKFLVEKTFSDVGGDFNKPDKETLLNVVYKLEEYATNYRKPAIINKHANEIKQLINKLE